MSKPIPSRVQQLAYRRARLQAQCAIQRRQLAEHAEQLEYELTGVDRAVSLLRQVTSKPALVSAGVALFTMIGPKRALRWVTQGAFWYTTGKRLLGVAASHPQLTASLQSAVRSLVAKTQRSERHSSIALGR